LFHASETGGCVERAISDPFSAPLILFLAGSTFLLSFESLRDLAVQISLAGEIALPAFGHH
jgi:hypothetical protein